MIIFFVLLSGVRGRWLWWAVRSWDIQSITDERKRLGVAWAWFDSDLGHAINQLLALVEIYQWWDRDSTADERLLQVIRFVKHKGDDRKASIPSQYQWIFDLLISASEFEEDILSLLWYTTAQTYLLPLQNTSESRPNGGFFGSFAVIKVFQGKVVDYEVRDSYILDYEQNGVKIEGPERLLKYLPHRDIHFVWANKTWFTYLDGDHIKKLYEKVYPGEVVRWVIFLRTDTFEQLIPWFTQQQRERQFTNAATDLIRGTDGFGKKELYVSQVSDILKDHGKTLLWSVVEKLPGLIEQGAINIYPYKVSVSGWRYGWGMEWRLRKNNLTTRFEQNTMYIREANTSYNKIDSFVKKTVKIENDAWVLYAEGEFDTIDVSAVPEGERNVFINYQLDIPLEYQQYIWALERKYGIQLEEREQHILGLIPTREARWLMHLGIQFDVLEVTGDIASWRTFDTPIPTNSAWWMVNLPGNGTQAEVLVRVRRR